MTAETFAVWLIRVAFAIAAATLLIVEAWGIWHDRRPDPGDDE